MYGSLEEDILHVLEGRRGWQNTRTTPLDVFADFLSELRCGGALTVLRASGLDTDWRMEREPRVVMGCGARTHQSCYLRCVGRGKRLTMRGDESEKDEDAHQRDCR